MWKRLKRKLQTAWNRFKAWVYGLLVSIGLIASPFILADADDVDLSWNNATEWTDNTPLSIDDLDVTVIMHRVVPLGANPSGAYAEIVRVPPTVETYIHEDLPNGLHCYVAFHIAKNGISGDFTDETCKAIDVRKPGKITGLSST